jgi:hypothetical protein
VPIVSFIDSAGLEWQVLEVRRSSTPGMVTERRESGWLSFTQGDERRRLSPIPPDWESYDAATLETLCMGAESIPREQIRRTFERRTVPRENATPDRRNPVSPAAEIHLVASSPPAEVSVPPEALRMAHERALTARAQNETVIDGLLDLRRLLRAQGIASDSNEFRAARRAFLEGYYFNS